MKKIVTPFKKPIFITRPLLPNLNLFKERLKIIWQSQWLSNNGQQHQLLEKTLAEELKVPYVSLFSNGTIALLTAVKSLDLEEGGEVITTPFTFPATPHSLVWNNLKPVFCDIDPKTLNIDASKIENLITKKTKAILGVHVFGTPCDVNAIQKIANKHKLKIIYDAAHAFGVKINQQGIGNFGDVTMFSFHPTKLFHTGEGGALVFQNKNLKDKCDLLKNFGIENEDVVSLPGINGKMNEIQAALGLEILKQIDSEKKKRELIKNEYIKYLKNIPGIIIIEDQKCITQHSFQYFVIQIDENTFGRSRNYVYEKFKEYNIFTRKYFYPLCSNYPHFYNLRSSNPKNLPIANKTVNQILSLPFYGQLSLKDIEKICQVLISFKL